MLLSKKLQPCIIGISIIRISMRDLNYGMHFIAVLSLGSFHSLYSLNTVNWNQPKTLF